MLCYTTKPILFPLGTILVAPEIENHGIDVQRLLRQHQTGDFGCVDPYDSAQNLNAIQSGEEILSQYDVMVGQNSTLICLMTEGDRSYTVVFILDKSKLELPDSPDSSDLREGEIPPGSESP